MRKDLSIPGRVAYGLGKGLLAGLAGTVAITIAQMIEMRITHRKPSTAPIDAAQKVLDVKAINKSKKEKVSNEVHWAYGTSWGLTRGVMDIFGLKGIPASLAHFAAIWGTALVMLPALKVAPPVKEWGAKTLAKDAMFHLVYIVAAGLVYDALDD